MPCREHLTQLRQREDELESLGVKILVVTFETPQRAKAYAAETDLPWPLLVNDDRGLYQSHGMGRGAWRNILGPAAWWAYFKLQRQGRRKKKGGEDLRHHRGDA
ncbi:MAG: redoxin domain-containing protein, partial [Planctomycetales bacterium]